MHCHAPLKLVTTVLSSTETMRGSYIEYMVLQLYTDGAERWYQNGVLHRLDGPAVLHANGVRSWYKNNVRHRIDGPAIELPDGDAYWYINGMCLYEEEQFNEYIQKMKLGQQK